MKYLGAITNDYDLVTKKYVDDAAKVIQTLTSGTAIGSVGGTTLYAPTGGSGTITSVKTTAGAHSTINVSSGAANFNVPTKTSHLTNDSGFTTNTGTITGITTSAGAHSTIDVSSGAVTFDVPTKTSHLRNDSGFTTNTGTITGVTAGSGLSGGGTSGAVTLNHSNSVTEGTIGSSSATSGATVSIPYATYDSNGHITGKGTHTHTITGFLTAETDPTVPSWAKESTKPSYTASEVGAVPIGSDGIYLDNADSKTKTISANSIADFSWTYTIPTGYMAIAMSANVRSVGNNYGRVRIFGFSQNTSGQTMTLSCGSRNDASSNATGISIRARILVIKNG